MPKNSPLEWQNKLFPPKMAMMKTSASFPHGVDAPGWGDDSMEKWMERQIKNG